MHARRAATAAALAVASCLSAAGAVSAQGESAGADGSTAAGSEPLWVRWFTYEVGDDGRLVNHPTVVRVDPVSGELTGRLDVEAEGCVFETLVGPADGALWLLDTGWPGVWGPAGAAPGPGPAGGPLVEADRHCIGYFPLDGSEPSIIELKAPKGGVWDVAQAAPLGGALWLAADDASTPARASTYDLWKVDPTDGSVKKVHPDVSSVAAVGDTLYYVDTSKARQDSAAWMSADGTTSGALDLPLREVRKKKDSRTLRVDAGDGTALYLDAGHAVYRYDPATSQATTMAASETGKGTAATRLAASGDGLWVVDGQEGFGLHVDHAPFADTLAPSPVGDFASLIAVAPDAIWLLQQDPDTMVDFANGVSLPSYTVTRVDAATLEPTRFPALPEVAEGLPAPITPTSG